MALDEGDRGDQPRVDAERRGRVEHFRVRDALDVAHACAAGRRRPRVALGAHADHRRARHQEYEDGRDDLDQPSVPPGAAPASLLRVGQVEEAADPAPPPAALDRPGDAVEDPRRRAERPRHRRHRIAPATASQASRRPAAAALLRILLVLWASAAPRRARHRRPTPRPTWPHVPQPFGDPPRTVGTRAPVRAAPAPPRAAERAAAPPARDPARAPARAPALPAAVAALAPVRAVVAAALPATLAPAVPAFATASAATFTTIAQPPAGRRGLM